MGLFNWLFGDDSSSSSITDTNIDTSPSVNIDGSPMMGSVVINGNPYGVTDTDTSCFGDSMSGMSSMDDSFGCGSSFDDSFSSMDDSFGCGSSFDDW